MKVTYNEKTDSLTVIFNDESSVAESDKDKPGVILDYDKDGNLVSLEVLDASRRAALWPVPFRALYPPGEPRYSSA